MSHRSGLVLLPMIHQGSHFHPRPGPQLLPRSVDGLEDSHYGKLPFPCLFQETRPVRKGLRICRLRGFLSGSCLIADRSRPYHGNHYVVRHRFAFHQHPGLIADNMQDSDKRPARTLHDLGHDTFPPLGSGLFLCDSHFHYVAVERTPGLGCLHEDVIVLTLHYHENKPLPGHLDFPGQLGQRFLFLFVFLRIPVPSAISVCHNNNFFIFADRSQKYNINCVFAKTAVSRILKF